MVKGIIAALVLSSIIVVISCRENDQPVPVGEYLLSKVYEDGTLQLEYRYSSDNYLIETNESKNTTIYSYKFENAWPKAVGDSSIYYNANGKILSVTEYGHDSMGRITSEEYYPYTGADSAKLSLTIQYSYDADDLLAKQVWVRDQKTYAAREYQYDQYDNLSSVSDYFYLDKVKTLVSTIEYTGAEEKLPKPLVKLEIEGPNFRNPYFVSKVVHTFGYSNDEVTTEILETMSDRQYNEASLLVAQTITKEQILPKKVREVHEMRYEYVIQ